MLQQTTVAAVAGRYGDFLTRFPDISSLSRAREDAVLAAWSGLGYYARARNLRRAAGQIVRLHGGHLPQDPAALRALPGFGEYMAAAVASLAFGARVAAVDANVTRVLSRLFAIAGTVGQRTHAGAVRGLATALLPRRAPGSLTAALMDLGQLVCTPRKPRCPACPLAALCEARSRGQAERFPRRRARSAISRICVAAACASRNGRALLARSDGALLSGLWQFPSAEGKTPAAALLRLRLELAPLGLALDPREIPAATRHTIVHRRLEIMVYRATATPNSKSETRGPKSRRWLTPAQLATAAIPTLTRKIAAAAGFLPLPPA